MINIATFQNVVQYLSLIFTFHLHGRISQFVKTCQQAIKVTRIQCCLYSHSLNLIWNLGEQCLDRIAVLICIMPLSFSLSLLLMINCQKEDHWSLGQVCSSSKTIKLTSHSVAKSTFITTKKKAKPSNCGIDGKNVYERKRKMRLKEAVRK